MSGPNIVPVVVLVPLYEYQASSFVKGDFFELPNEMWTSIRTYQERDVTPVLESSLVTKDSYYDGIQRTSLGTGSAPLYQSSEVKDATPLVIDILFDINVSMVDDTGWIVKVNASPVPVQYTRFDGVGGRIYLQTPIVNGDTVTVEYDGLGKTVAADTGDFMASLAAQAVTNSVAP